MKTLIYIARHCESEGNACRRNHAQFDGIVTKKGLMQAQALAERFRDIPVSAIYSSDSYRCRATAAPLAEQKRLDVKYRALLREYTIGIWEGSSIGCVARRHPEQWKKWIETPYANDIPGCDSFETTAVKGYEMIKRMAQENPGGTVVAVTHSCKLMCALTLLLGQPISYYTQIKGGDNTAVTLVEADETGALNVVYINDDSHLPQELKRSNYTGRSAATNMDFEYLNMPSHSERLTQWLNACAEEYQKTPADMESIRECISNAHAQSGKYVFFPVLEDRVCGVCAVRRLSGDMREYGALDFMYIDGELRNKGYREQAFGECIDVLRRDGCKYILLPKQGDDNIMPLLDRFCTAEYEHDSRYVQVRVTVPGLEGPVY